MINEILRNILYYVEALLKRPFWAVGPALLTLAVGFLIVLSLARTYQADAQLLIEAPQATSLVPSTVANEHLQFIEQRVLARDSLIALARKLDLFPELRDTMAETKFAQLIRSQINIQTVAAEPSDRYSGTSAMRIVVSAPNPEQASATVNELVSRIADENRRQRVLRASEMSEFLSREVENMSGKMSEREAVWTRYFEENAQAVPARMESVDAELQERDREITAIDQSIATLEQEMRLLEAQLRIARERPEASTHDMEQLAQLESDLAAKSVAYSTGHPEIRSLTQKINGLRHKVALAASADGQDATQPTREVALLAERVDIAKAGHASLTARRSEINERILVLRNTVARAPSVQSQMEAIERERETLQRGIDEMRGRLSTARIGERLERDNSTEHVQVLERPETPRYPSSPSRTRIMLVVLAAAAAAGAGGLYLGDSLRRSIRGTFDLRTQLEGATLIAIPRWDGNRDRKSLADSITNWIARLVGGGSTAEA